MKYLRITNALGLYLDRGRLGVIMWSVTLYLGVDHWRRPKLLHSSQLGYGRQYFLYEIWLAWFHAGYARQKKVPV